MVCFPENLNSYTKEQFLYFNDYDTVLNFYSKEQLWDLQHMFTLQEIISIAVAILF